MNKLAVIFGVLVAATLVSTGCGNSAAPDTAANAAPPGATKETAAQKNGQATAKGMSPKDLTVPGNGGQPQFGSKTGGGN